MLHSKIFSSFAVVILIATCSGHSVAQRPEKADQQGPTAVKPEEVQKSGEETPAPAGQSTDRVSDGSSAERPAADTGSDGRPDVAAPMELPPPLPIDLVLFRPDSLAGWTHSPTPPTGWSIAQRRVAGNAGATPLLSGFSLREFELQFKWTAGESTALVVDLPRIPGGPTLSVSFGETSGCGQIQEDKKQLSSGKAISRGDQPHTSVIRREGEQLTVEVDGQRVSKVTVASDQRFGLGLAVRGGDVTIEEMRLHEPFGEPMFNGTDLTGWWCPGRIEAWQPIDGELVLAGGGGNYLRTEKLYGNYTLSFEFKINKGGNSGLGIRTPRNGWPSGDGMELQLLDRPNVDKGGMMSIYRNVPPLAVAHQTEDWNQVVVKAEGRMISAWVNGELVQQVNTVWEPELKHRDLKGWIGFQDHGAKIQVRHLKITEAPDGLGLQAWYGPRPETAGEFVFDRLMNPERLSRDDGSWGTVITAKVDAKGEHTLAELKGPGALVRISSKDASGELAFHFDGEKESRITCKARDLAGQVPGVPGNKDKTPVLTSLPFEKSVKVRLLDGGPAVYRFHSIRFPTSVSVKTYERSAPIMPNSLAAALDYRFHHHQHGVVRQNDPYLRVVSDRKKLAPGEEIDSVQVDGAGLVQWLQVHCPKQELKADRLWMDVTIDGENRPAISAPVRFFFSGAAVAGRFGNYLLTDRDGPINRLAIPFGNGIRISLSNRCEQPIVGVGLTASIQQATNEREAADFSDRLRLRGVFQSAAIEPTQGTLFEQKGRGRWVGLVWDTSVAEEAEDDSGRQPSDEKAGDTADADEDSNGPSDDGQRNVEVVGVIDALKIDGELAAGWRPANAIDLLGRPGQAEDFRGVLSGCQGGFRWGYLQFAPIDFEREIVASVPEHATPGNRLSLFYMK